MFYPGMFRDGHSGNNIGTSLGFNSVILAVFIDYSVSERITDLGFHFV